MAALLGRCEEMKALLPLERVDEHLCNFRLGTSCESSISCAFEGRVQAESQTTLV